MWGIEIETKKICKRILSGQNGCNDIESQYTKHPQEKLQTGRNIRLDRKLKYLLKKKRERKLINKQTTLANKICYENKLRMLL